MKMPNQTAKHVIFRLVLNLSNSENAWELLRIFLILVSLQFSMENDNLLLGHRSTPFNNILIQHIMLVPLVVISSPPEPGPRWPTVAHHLGNSTYN